MEANSDGCSLTTVVTCEGDLSDPCFPGRFERVLGTLQCLIGDQLKVRKLEPWNSVRVTLSIPREAALRLRQLASDGSQQLRALGILSVQVEGDQVISLRLAGPSETQEIILQTVQDATPGPSSVPTESANLSQLLQGNNQLPPEQPPAPSEKVQFPSPNVVCPADSIVPKVPQASVAASLTPSSNKPYTAPFPFTTMNQAIGTSTNQYPQNPPPPYPGNKHQPVNMTSPLLVNLLQNEGVQSPKQAITPTELDVNLVNGIGTGPPPYVQSKPPPPFVQKTIQPPQRIVKPHQVQKPVNMPIKSNKQDVGSNAIFRQNSIKSILPLASPQMIPSPATLPTSLTTTLPTSLPTSLPTILSTSIQPSTLPIDLGNSIPNSPLTPKSDTVSTLQQPQKLQQQQSVAVLKPTTNNNANNRTVPYHSYPSYNNSWEQPMSMPQVQELTPTLPDLKTELDLDNLLPTLMGSPPDIPEEVTEALPSRPKYLINPLTGELEPQSSSDSEDDAPSDVFTDLPSPTILSDEDTNSTHRPDTTDRSDGESRSCHSDSGKYKHKKVREKGRDSPSVKQEKIKLRLKLEKSEPVSPACKVDVSFINTQPPKKAVPEEPRVPPLHISLRGRNHAVINNKKRVKLNPDGTPMKPKVKKVQKDDLVVMSGSDVDVTAMNNAVEQLKSDIGEVKKAKKPRDLSVFNFKEKLKERRGSDSELARAAKKHGESNGVLIDKKRRLSQTEESQTLVLGSTNTGTVSSLSSSHKPRKDKLKVKDALKLKDLNRCKSYSKNLMEKLTNQVPLPTTGDIDMEAKFKQRLMEEPTRMPSKPITPISNSVVTSDNNGALQNLNVEDLIHTLTDPVEVKDKPPEPDKCNTPDRKGDIITEKQPSRSPNSGGQGEDSGIESMDALSEKSPNQASQSPHADIQDNLKPKTQVPHILDIEAQLAKMEGFTGDELPETNHNNETKEQCCGLNKEPDEPLSKNDQKKEEDLDPLPVRVTPPLYTYSNPDKSRAESPNSDVESNHCGAVKSKSLLEQLLIDIPENIQPSSPSPAARSVRTRASSKMNSPELSSPVLTNKQNRAPPTTKRKRQESDSSNNSVEESRGKKQRKCSENTNELIKACIGIDPTAKPTVNNSVAKKKSEESSDSDEPLIEYAGKVRKSQVNVSAPNAVGGNVGMGVQRKLKPLSNSMSGTAAMVGNAILNNKTVPVNTRRSIRAQPALNTRSKGDKSQPDAEMLRRKTRSAVSEGEGKRRKDIK